MGKYIDFAEIKEQHSIEKVAEMLGLELKKSGPSQYRGPDPTAEDSNERALAITPAKNLWYSFHAQKGGDQLELIAYVHGTSVRDAAEWLAGPDPSPKKGNNEDGHVSRGADQPASGFRPLTYLEPNHPAVEALGFEPEDAERIGAGYAKRGVLRGTVAIPVRDETGKLLGYVGTTDAVLPSQWHF